MTDNDREPRASWFLSTVQRYEAQLVRYAARLVGDEQRAQDVVQDAGQHLVLLIVPRAHQVGEDSQLALGRDEPLPDAIVDLTDIAAENTGLRLFDGDHKPVFRMRVAGKRRSSKRRSALPPGFRTRRISARALATSGMVHRV